jgi:hypothetical protein
MSCLIDFLLILQCCWCDYDIQSTCVPQLIILFCCWTWLRGTEDTYRYNLFKNVVWSSSRYEFKQSNILLYYISSIHFGWPVVFRLEFLDIIVLNSSMWTYSGCVDNLHKLAQIFWWWLLHFITSTWTQCHHSHFSNSTLKEKTACLIVTYRIPCTSA